MSNNSLESGQNYRKKKWIQPLRYLRGVSCGDGNHNTSCQMSLMTTPETFCVLETVGIGTVLAATMVALPLGQVCSRAKTGTFWTISWWGIPPGLQHHLLSVVCLPVLAPPSHGEVSPCRQCYIWPILHNQHTDLLTVPPLAPPSCMSSYHPGYCLQLRLNTQQKLTHIQHRKQAVIYYT